MKITLKNVGSYKEPVILEADKRVNLVYGLNGTGKTLLSTYLYQRHSKTAEDKKVEVKDDNNKENHDDQKIGVKNPFADCKDDIDSNSTVVLVYNQEFIKDNFHEITEQPGIFTLSEQNKEAEENINKASEAKSNLNNDLKKHQSEQKNLEAKFKNQKKDARERLWEIKEDYSGKDKPLDYCLEGMRDKKQKLFDHILKIPLENKVPDKVEDLEKRVESIGEDEELDPVEVFKDGSKKNEIKDIETNKIFQEKIVGKENLSVSELIEQLDNSDWVKEGFDKYISKDNKEHTQDCPFCQEQTVTAEFIKKLQQYFGGKYKEKLNQLRDLEANYKSCVENFDKWYESTKDHKFIKKSSDKFELLKTQLNNILVHNLRQIEEKIKKPSTEVELSSSIEQTTKLNEFIKNIKSEIEEHNKIIENKEQEKENIKNTFWKIMRKKYDSTIARYKSDLENHKAELQKLKDQIDEIILKIAGQKKIIEHNQSLTANIEEAIDNINKNLEDLGITNFRIEKYETKDSNSSEEKSVDKYTLVRDDQDSNKKRVFKTLSEGEKTVISFLYFLETCKGTVSTEKPITNDRIVVIDDPISSLSHMYVFNVAQLIKTYFYKDKKEYKNLLVLTHNLYFFHELVKIMCRDKDKEHWELFRITKQNNKSAIGKMKRNEIKSNYEEYWKILKEIREEDKNNVMLANVMRNILECFFGFIQSAELKDALEELEKLNKNKYGAFIRYMNRESHFNAIDDQSELDYTIFNEAFKKVFKDSGYEDHYNTMIRRNRITT